jgi:hypothetical protein
MVSAAAYAFEAEDCNPDNDAWEALIEAVLAEAASLSLLTRTELAARVLALGGYESADDPAGDSRRACLAMKIAARLSERA